MLAMWTGGPGSKRPEFDPEHPWMTWWLRLVILVLGSGQRQEDLWGLLGSQASWISKIQVWWENLGQKIRWSVSEGWFPRLTWSLHTSACTYTRIYTHVYPPIKIKLNNKHPKICGPVRCLGGKRHLLPSLTTWVQHGGRLKTDPSKLISTQMLWYLCTCACVCGNTQVDKFH